MIRIAAGIFVAAGLGLLASSLWPSPTSAMAALQEAQEALAKTRTVSFEIKANAAEGRAGATARIRILAPARARIDEPGGNYAVTDLKTGRTLRVDVGEKKARVLEARREPRPADGGIDLYEFFRRIEQHKTRSLPSKEIEGVEAVGFEVKANPFGLKVAPRVIRVWVHPESKLLLRMESEPDSSASAHSYGLDPVHTVVSKNFIFDEPMDSHPFSMDPPEGYQVVQEKR